MDVETKFEIATPNKEEFRNFQIFRGVWGPQWWIFEILFRSFTHNPSMEVETKFEVATPIIEEFRNLGRGEGPPIVKF